MVIYVKEDKASHVNLHYLCKVLTFQITYIHISFCVVTKKLLVAVNSQSSVFISWKAKAKGYTALMRSLATHNNFN